MAMAYLRDFLLTERYIVVCRLLVLVGLRGWHGFGIVMAYLYMSHFATGARCTFGAGLRYASRILRHYVAFCE